MEEQDTVTVFDWDDTLMPTTHLNANKNIGSYPLISYNINTLISRAEKYGSVLIITNAELDWVKFCIKLLPGCETVLNNIRIISAKTHGYDIGENNTWKKRMFLSILPEYLTDNITQLVCFGDAYHDREASLKIKNIFKGKIKVKNIKYCEFPSRSQLYNQQEIIMNNFDSLYRCNQHLDLMIMFKPGEIIAPNKPSLSSEENDPMFDIEF